MKQRNSISVAAVMALTAGLFGQSARATVIYSDTFSGTAGDLNGRAAEVSSGTLGGTAGATWVSSASSSTTATISTTSADAAFVVSGSTHVGADSTFASVGAIGTGADANLITNAYLPFSPDVGHVYDFHLDVLPSGVGASTNWLGMAFATAGLNGHAPSGSASAISNDNPFGLLLVKGSGLTQAFAGVGTANGQTIANSVNYTSATAGSPYNSLDIILDTTGATYTLNWIVNGTTELATPYHFGTNPSIGAVMFGTNKLTGNVANFSLSTTPEPASLALLSLAGLAGFRRRRR